MKQNLKNEYLSIPNLMGYFRILLIPLYLYLYICVKSYRLAIFIMLLSFLTDFLDGKIARRFHMVTEFGKILDPVADKLTQGALALGFSFRYPAITILLLVFLLKELCMLFLGIYMMKRQYRMDGAQKHGKLCTAVLDFTMLLLLVFPDISYFNVNLLSIFATLVMLFSFVKYLRMYWTAYRDLNNHNPEKTNTKSKKLWKFLLAVILLILLYASAAILPYAEQPTVSEETVQNLQTSDFYGDSDGGERAKVISDNGEALAERVRLISQSKEEIILSTFDFDADSSGKILLSALLNAADRGVSVKILIDGLAYTTGIQGNPWFLALTETDNVSLKVYNPINLIKPWTLMGRLHDKYLIADSTAYILGGRNSYDYFLGDQEGYKNYDWDVLVFTNNSPDSGSMRQLQSYFHSVWQLPDCHAAGKQLLFKNHPAVQDCRRKLQNLYQQTQAEHNDWFSPINILAATVPTRKIQLVSNPSHVHAKEPVVFYTITELMKQAEESVVFHTPYVICNDWMTGRLKEICTQIPKVQMMTNSVANNGNPFGAMDYRENKEKLLDTGLQIMEYDGGISYHGKCFTIDSRISAIGSFNWDMRSTYLDTELMLIIDSEELNRQLRKEMLKYEKNALKVKDISSYELADGQSPRPLTAQKKFSIDIIRLWAYWARFLM
ncbi:phospholipase D-like domain-containing protein [Lachnospiraceae bacterium 46-15]